MAITVAEKQVKFPISNIDRPGEPGCRLADRVHRELLAPGSGLDGSEGLSEDFGGRSRDIRRRRTAPRKVYLEGDIHPPVRESARSSRRSWDQVQGGSNCVAPVILLTEKPVTMTASRSAGYVSAMEVVIAEPYE